MIITTTFYEQLIYVICGPNTRENWYISFQARCGRFRLDSNPDDAWPECWIVQWPHPGEYQQQLSFKAHLPGFREQRLSRFYFPRGLSYDPLLTHGFHFRPGRFLYQKNLPTVHFSPVPNWWWLRGQPTDRKNLSVSLLFLRSFYFSRKKILAVPPSILSARCPWFLHYKNSRGKETIFRRIEFYWGILQWKNAKLEFCLWEIEKVNNSEKCLNFTINSSECRQYYK